jgi:NAD(P)H-dependent flavin oxidoreductase YrpB (nitropropane dioxygenase family)
MKTFTKFFDCKYPIACMAMNKVSDVNLAVAVRRAGCLPSLSIFNYFVRLGVIDPALFERDLKQYSDTVGDASILISTNIGALLDLDGFVDMLLSYRVRAVEIILEDQGQEAEADNRRYVVLPQVIARLKANGTMVFTKTLLPSDSAASADGIILKGPDGAGRGNLTGETLEQLFDRYTTMFPGKHVITSGGVGTSAQLKYYIDRGAFGVGIGTMFAVSAESKISTETKLKLVASGAGDVKRLDNGKTDTDSQNAIVFSSIAGDNHNNTRGLMAGIQTPGAGHVFIGKGIEHASEILTCEAIVQRLVKDL